ncbi:MAG: deoxyribonuclease IV [Chloroflexota bacterium]
MSSLSPAAPPVDIDPEEARAGLGGRPIGPHVALGAGLPRAMERIRLVGASAVQVFADNPTAWRRKPEPPPDIDAFRRGLDDAGVGPLAIHAPYLVNLASPDPVVLERSMEVMHAELTMGARYGARFVNVHIGSHKGEGLARGLDRAGETVARILDAVPPGPDVPLLVLEDSAGQGDSVGVTMAELGTILRAAAAHGADPSRVGVCLDTAHLWGAGYAIDSAAGVDALVAELAAEVGLERLAMVHLNDSRAGRGSRADRHEHVGGGSIGAAGMAALLSHPALARVPAYLETPGMDTGWDAVNMDRVRRLLAGGTLPALPPEAYLARGDRS